MKNGLTIPAALGAALILAACVGDQATEPELRTGPLFAKGGAAACPTAADFVVTDEAELIAALAMAVSGQVIGIDGMIGIATAFDLETPGITLTCATAGSGVFSAGEPIPLFVVADGVVVEHLVIDGTAAFTPIFAGFDAEGVRFSDNTVTCGVLCVWLVQRAPGTVIVDNSFETSGRSGQAVIQASTAHGAIVSRNIFKGDQAMRFGIRVAASDGAIVSHNTFHGPWGAAAISTMQTTIGGVPTGGDLSIYSNRVSGASEFGIDASGDGNVLRSNRVTGAGLFAVRIRGCSNVLVGNNVESADNGGGVVFDMLSGANSLAGNKDVVVDDGEFDCDGDGVNDPNIITGSGAVEHGANLGELVSDAIFTIPTPKRPIR